MKNNYKVFVASSLRLEEHRAAACVAIEKANELMKDKDLWFSEFFYEKRPISKINQKLEKHDAQAPADKALRESALFFLIIDDKIRSLTQYEFELALEYFNRGELPQYIFIFYNEEAEKQSDGDGLSYERFKEVENLNKYIADRQNNVTPHSRIYPIPFSNVENLKKKMTEELLTFADSEERPFPGALRGNKVTKDHFFIGRRNEKCTDLYFRRKIDEELDDAIKTRKIVLLSGPSLSGKTRAMMEALKAVDDGWVFILRQEDTTVNEQDNYLVSEINRLSRYLTLQNHPKLYIALDNIDLWKPDEQKALEKLIEQVRNSNAVIIGTVSSKNLSISGINPSENPQASLIGIKEMDEHDFAEVREFFVSAGVQFDERNLRYRRTGALFVDLNDILCKYINWTGEGSKIEKLAKNKLLKAIKALSIWRDDYIGDRSLILSLTAWFFPSYIKCDLQKNELDELCKDALQSLISDRNLGVSSTGSSAPVVVQEYIYRYFIDYDGSLLTDDKASSFEGEQELARQLLWFCEEMHKKEPKLMEALTVQVSRLCRRCTFKKPTVNWLYGLWAGNEVKSEEDKELSMILRCDRGKCEQRGDERMAHFYSSIIQTYIYQGCDSMAEARHAYEQCPEHMRTDHLLSALMSMAKTPEERNEIRATVDYERMKNLPYVIAAEVEWADDYSQAKNAFERFANDKTPIETARCLLDDERRVYGVYQLRRAIGTLALKVADENEYVDFCAILRAFYLYLASNTKLFRQIIDHELAYQPEDLTLIDLLAILQPYSLRKLAENVFGGDMDASKALTDTLIECVNDTLRGHFTDEATVRLTVSILTSCLIRQLADAPYDELYDNIFTPLKMSHPLHSDKMLILRSSYTYTAILGNRYCDVQQANNLLENDLIPHTLDAANNPLTINTYTLNILMDKSKDDRNRMNVRMIDKLYDQLHKQRDAFTYCRLIAIADSLQESLELLKQMDDQGIKPNTFILNELMKRHDVNLAKALGFLDLSEVKLPDGFVYERLEWRQTDKGGSVFNPNDIIGQLRPEMSELHVSWGNLFRKECADNDEKLALTVCLSYLEVCKPKLLEGGNIYNNLITNSTYFPNVNSIMNFVRAKVKERRFRPDSYTAKHVIDRILKMNGTERLKAIDRLNELLAITMEGKTCKLDNVIVCHRLKIYQSQQDPLKMIFFDRQGIAEEKNCSAIGYVEAMEEYGHPVNYYAIGNLLNIKKGLNGNTYNRLMEVLMWQQAVYTYQPNDLKIIREQCVGYYENYIDRIPALSKPMTAHEHNKTMAWKFKMGKVDTCEAVVGLNWSNPNSAICSFNDILDHLINSQRKTGTISFSNILSIYVKYIKKEHHAPTSHTIALLAKATTCWDDMLQLLSEYDLLKNENPRLVLESTLLSHISSYANSVKELKQRTCLMHTKGCAYSLKAANNYVFRIATRLLKLDTAPSAAILDDLLHFVVEGGDVRQMLQKDERSYLMLDLYADPSNVSAEVLRTLIRYNYSRPEALRYSDKTILECIKEKYYACIIPLLEMLKNDEVLSDTYLPYLFDAIHNGSRPTLSDKLLGKLVRKLPQNDLKAYSHFLQRLYEMDCQEIEGAVLSIVFFLRTCLHNATGRDQILTAARKTLAQIIVYADLNKLRNGHLLIDKAPEEYARWCFRFMNSKKIYKLLKEKTDVYDSFTWSEIIIHHASRLDDGFPCSLKIYKKNTDPGILMEEDTLEYVKEQEQRYAKSIQRGDIYFSEVLKLPILWINAKWKPSCELVMAMIASLTRVAWTPGTNETYQKDALERLAHIEKAFMDAYRNKAKTVLIFYWHLAILHPQDIHNREIPLPIMGRQLYTLYLDHLAECCTNGAPVTRKDAALLRAAEACCSKYTMQEEDAFDWLQRLPERWSKVCDAKGNIWLPCPSMVMFILRYYLQLSKGKNRKASIARRIIKGVKKSIKIASETHHEDALVFYNTLGPTPLKCNHFVKVPLTALKKL